MIVNLSTKGKFIDSELDKWKYMTMLPYKPFQFPTSTM
jgi:hypothetical protein